MADVSGSAQTITPDLVRTAVGMLSCRFGTPDAEADRRGRVRALLQSSRAFALALERFARTAAPRTRGEFSTADMHAEADAMAQTLADWTVAIVSSAETYHACHGPDVPPASLRAAALRSEPESPFSGA
ncbi:MAG: hypothetical protein JWN79_1012 [Gemmatimonadetes bacterium]|jgi:hypothetical protein|nr:hypothetical protein [Gemmatimonadota bacterium]